jgi:hypothetical protein
MARIMRAGGSPATPHGDVLGVPVNIGLPAEVSRAAVRPVSPESEVYRVGVVIAAAGRAGATASFQFNKALNTMLNSPWFCHR